jgi:hypothetical protein
MKMRLAIRRGEATLYDGVHDVSDADSFGRAFTQAWNHLQEKDFEKATSVGALFDSMEERLLDRLLGADIRLTRA